MSDNAPGSAGEGAAAPDTVTVGDDYGDHAAADAILRSGLLADYADDAPKAPAAEDSADKAEDGDRESDPTGEEEGQSEPQDDKPAAIEPPRSWSDEDKAEFAKLPPAAQRVIAQRESERDRAFTQKAEEVANERKAAAAEREATLKAAAEYKQNLEKLYTLAVPDAAEFAKLADPVWAAQYPAEAVTLQAKFNAAQQRIGAIQAEHAKVTQQLQQEQERRQGEFLATERQKLVERVPDFADPEKGRALTGELSNFLQQKGFSANEIGSVVDHRVVALAVNAMRLEQAEAARKTAEATRKAAEAKATAQTAPRVQKPGTAPDTRDTLSQREREMVKDFFSAERPSDRDAARLIGRGLGLT